MELQRLIQHPEEMNRETLYDLRTLLALYPYYQTARLLMLENLYLLHDPSFNEELRRAAIYISDRKVIFKMIEAAHYQLKRNETETSREKVDKNNENSKSEDRTSSLIDHFLDSIPADNNIGSSEEKEKRKPTPADATVDYVAYLMETETNEEKEQTSRTISLIDDFMEEGGFNLKKLNTAEESTMAPAAESEEAQEKQEIQTEKEKDEGKGIFTETLARIYIKQGKYERAYQIIERLHKLHPHKSAYYVDQLRFLEKLMLNKRKQ